MSGFVLLLTMMLLLMMPNHDDADDAVTDVRHDDAAGLVFL